MLVFDVIQVTQVLRRVDGGKVVRSCAFIAMLSVEYVLVGSDANGFSGLACLLSGKSGPISVFVFSRFERRGCVANDCSCLLSLNSEAA